MKKLFLIGGGGHCRSCIDVIELEGKFEIVGIFDLAENIGKKIFNYTIVGTDGDIEKYISEENYFLVTIGQIKNPELRIEKLKKLNLLSARIATIVSPRAYVSARAKLGEGVIIMHDALINANSSVGDLCIINTKALIEHDAVIEMGCHISTGAIVNGGCTVNKMSFVGSQCVVEEGATIAERSLIPAGTFYRRERQVKN